MWKNTGQQRPAFADSPTEGQESVWDYPRPPAVQADRRQVEVMDGDTLLARTKSSIRVLETASPPTFYIPPADVDMSRLTHMDLSTVCEWKGAARYWALHADPATPVAWAYPRPRARFDRIRDYLAFYPGRIACFVDGERVQAQPGRFYGGWVTAEIAGPFKGEPGTGHW